MCCQIMKSLEVMAYNSRTIIPITVHKKTSGFANSHTQCGQQKFLSLKWSWMFFNLFSVKSLDERKTEWCSVFTFCQFLWCIWLYWGYTTDRCVVRTMSAPSPILSFSIVLNDVRELPIMNLYIRIIMIGQGVVSSVACTFCCTCRAVAAPA